MVFSIQVWQRHQHLLAAIYKYNTSSSISLVLFCCLYKSVWRSIVWDNKPSLFIKQQQGGDGGGPKYLYWRLICRPDTSVSVHPFPVWLSVMCKRDRWRKRRFSWHFDSSWPHHQPTISAALRPFSDVLCVTQTTADDLVLGPYSRPSSYITASVSHHLRWASPIIMTCPCAVCYSRAEVSCIGEKRSSDASREVSADQNN